MWLRHYTLRDLFSMMTLIGVGVGYSMFLRRTLYFEGAPYYWSREWTFSVWLFGYLFIACGACIGAGVFVPLTHKRIGAFLGIALVFLAMSLGILPAPPHQ